MSPELLASLPNFGLGGLIFLIWYFEKKQHQSHHKLLEDYRRLSERTNHANSSLLTVVKDNTQAMTSLREIIQARK